MWVSFVYHGNDHFTMRASQISRDVILEEKKESNVAQTKINLQYFQFIFNSY